MPRHSWHSKAGSDGLCARAASGAGNAELLLKTSFAVSPEGLVARWTFSALRGSQSKTKADLWVLERERKRHSRPDTIRPGTTG